MFPVLSQTQSHADYSLARLSAWTLAVALDWMDWILHSEVFLFAFEIPRLTIERLHLMIGGWKSMGSLHFRNMKQSEHWLGDLTLRLVRRHALGICCALVRIMHVSRCTEVISGTAHLCPHRLKGTRPQ